MADQTEVKLPESLEVVAIVENEYSRRNLHQAKAVGITANVVTALTRLRAMKRTPVWMLAALEGIQSRAAGLPHEMALWRDTAPDRPAYVHCHLSDAESALKARDAEIERLRGGTARLYNAGLLLSNWAFNMARREGQPLSAEDCYCLKLMQERWDAALKEPS
jgi:hypothetical protein